MNLFFLSYKSAFKIRTALNMTKHLGRCNKGDRCYKTIHKYPFVKFNFICAIKYGKVIGYKLYEKIMEELIQINLMHSIMNS